MTVRLRDGRQLGFAPFGDPAGAPVFYLHGTFGSRLEAVLLDRAARQSGVRVVGVDRPGHGLSSHHEPRSFAAFAEDLRELADHLGFERFGLIGWSGGGAHAAAVGVALGERVRRISLVAANGPGEALTAPHARPLLFRLGASLARWTFLHLRVLGLLLRPLLRRSAAALLGMTPRWALCPGDARAFADPGFRDGMGAAYREGLRPGARGAVHDLGIQFRPWDVPLRECGVPVDIWYGARDFVCPPAFGHYYAGIFRDARLAVFPDEGHAVLHGHAEEIVSAHVVLEPAMPERASA